ncbi:hypothetical protein ACFL3T_03690 [Patescibacteria group bacterium]
MLTQNKNFNFWLKSGIFTVLAIGVAFAAMPQDTHAAWSGANCTWSGVPGSSHLTVTAGAPCVLTGPSSTAWAFTVDAGGTLNIGDGTTGGQLTGIAGGSIYGTVNVIEDVNGPLDESYITTTGSFTLNDNGQLNIDQKAVQGTWSSAAAGLSINSSSGNNATFNLQGGEFDAGVTTTVYYTSTGPNLVVGSGATFTSDALYTNPTTGGGEIINDGTLNIIKAGYQVVTLHPGTQITNNGIFNIESTGSGTDLYIKNGATVTNGASGVFNMDSATTGGFVNIEAGGSLDNDGTFASDVLVRNYGTFDSSNTFDVGTTVTPKDFTTYDGATSTTSGSNDLTVWGDAYVYDDSTWNNTGSVVIKDSLYLNKSATPNPPTLNNSSGDIDVDEIYMYQESTLDNGGTINVLNAGSGQFSFRIDDSVVNNLSGGTITITDPDINSVQFRNGATLNNSNGAVFDTNGAFYIEGSGADYTYLNNDGDMYADFLSSTAKVEFNNTGLLDTTPNLLGNGMHFNSVEFILNNSGTLIDNNWFIMGGGDFNLLNGSQLTAPSMSVSSGTSIQADAGSQIDTSLQLGGASTLINDGTLNLSNYSVKEGSVLTNDNVINSPGQGAIYDVGSELINSPGATINNNEFLVGASGKSDGLLTNNGVIDLDTLLRIENQGTLVNNNDFHGTASMNMRDSTSSLVNNGTFSLNNYNVGTSILDGGSVTNNSDMTVGGTLTINDSGVVTNEAGATNFQVNDEIIMEGSSGKLAQLINNDDDFAVTNIQFILNDYSDVDNAGTMNLAVPLKLLATNTTFDNSGSVTGPSLYLGENPNNGGVYTAANGSVNDFDNVYIGDAGITGGSLVLDNGATTDFGDVTVSNGGSVTNNASVTINADFTVDQGASFNNGSTLSVTGDTHINDDGTTFTNDGTFNSYRLYVGQLGVSDGGDYINNGVTNVTYSSGGTEQDSINIYEGSIVNANTDLGVNSFNYDARMWIGGTASESGVFQNSGVVDAGGDALYLMDYSLLDLDGGRFVQYEAGCAPAVASTGQSYLRSTVGAGNALIDIASGATFSSDSIEVGQSGTSSGSIINNGTIAKIDTAGVALDCPLELWLVENSTLDNKTDGTIDLGVGNGQLRVQDNVIITSEVNSTITGDPGTEFDPGGEIELDGVNTEFDHSGDISNIQAIQLKGNSAVGGPLFTAQGGSTVSVAGFSVGNSSSDTGGTLQVELGGQISADIVGAEGYGVINADGQIDAVEGIHARGGNISGGATINLNDISDVYEFGVMYADNTNDTNIITIGSGVEVHLKTPYDTGGGNFVSGGLGFTSGTGESKLILNGILQVLDYDLDPAVESAFYVGGTANGTIEIGPDGLFDYDEQGDFVVNSPDPYGLIDNSNDPDEGFDIEAQCILNGNADLNNRMDCVDLIHVQSNGDIDVGLDGVVTVEGSETIVDGFIELDGIWNAGNLTVNDTGRISSGDDPSYDETNFLLNVENLVVTEFGEIVSDGVSSRGGHVDGGGSYGGTSKGRLDDTVYGQVKMDETFTPLYGESGINVGSVPQGNGGGGVRIHSTGNITMDGEISADGTDASDPGQHGGAGGTVIIVHEPTDPGAFFTGTGIISASGGGSIGDLAVLPGGGGRISISSPLFEYTDAVSYDFEGNIEAGSGENSASAPAEYAAAGTIFFGGDEHNPNGTLIVHQLDRVPDTEKTHIPNTGDNIFDKIEVLGQGIVDFFVDPTAPTVCYQTDGAIAFPTLDCDDYRWPDKPKALFVNTRATGAQGADLFQEPGYQVADGVSNEDLFVQDLTPVFSFVHTNSVNPAAVITQIEIEVDDDADFTSPVWDYLKTDLTTAGGGDVVDGSQTEDIIYNEDGSGDSLVDGVTYFIRSKFVNAPGLWSHADYNNQWRFTASAAPFVPPPAGGTPADNNGPGGGINPLLFPQEEEPEEEVAEETAAQEEEETTEESTSEEQPESHEAATEEGTTTIATAKVPRKPRPLAEEEEGPSEEHFAEPIEEAGEASFSCSRAGVTERIINEFNLNEVFVKKDAKCLENWEHCMLPFLIHSNYDASEESYFSDVFPEDLVGDANPLPPREDLVGDANPLPAFEGDLVGDDNPILAFGELIGDANPLPPVHLAAEILTQKLVDAVEFGTRHRMVQGYYEEEGSPFRPYETMSKIEIIKLLNFVIGFEWKYFEEYAAEFGGEENLDLVDVKAADINEWWHVRYYNFACEGGLVPCDPSYEFQPNADCNVDWLNEIISKYKKYYDDRDLDELQNIDSDKDSISNIDEEKIFFTDPQLEDTDTDELSDDDEIYIYKTSPLLTDTDFDGLSDGDEVNIHGTSPTNPDTDGDGSIDSVELRNGTDPLDPLSTPDLEAWATLFGIDLENGSQDSDLDGLADLLEFKYGTGPLNPDTDDDTLTDGNEVLLYRTDPLTFTDLRDLGAMITNIQNGMILTDPRPLIQGIVPKAEMDVLLILRNEFGHELQVGKTTSDENNAFVLFPEFDLRDGEFYLFIKAMDPKNSKVHNSPLVLVNIDSTLNVESPTPERLADKLITEDILLKELKVEVGSKMPTLSGKTGYKNQVIATWQSAIGVSSIVADISAGDFHITAPIELPYGAHTVSAYSIRESDQAMSKVIGVDFDIKETEKQVVSFEPKQEDTSYILYIVLGVIAVIVIGLIIYLRSRKKPEVAESTNSPNQNNDEKDVA